MRFLKSFLLCLTMIFVACEDTEFIKDPAANFVKAREDYDDKDWDLALPKLNEFRSRFPYSRFAVEAALMIADCHFQLAQYEEAASAYMQFAKLHPKHKQLGFVLYRVGESYWQLSPDSVDREQEYTQKAIDEWAGLIERLPNNRWAKKATSMVKEGKLRIAQSFEFVAKFYCKQEIYHACAFRSINLARRFPEFDEMRKDALLRAADSLVEVAKVKKEDPQSDKNIYLNTLSAEEILALSKKLRTEATKSRRQQASH